MYSNSHNYTVNYMNEWHIIAISIIYCIIVVAGIIFSFINKGVDFVVIRKPSELIGSSLTTQLADWVLINNTIG